MDHYERLAVARDAGPRQIARAFRRAARRAHPDAGGSADDFAAVAEAYRVLSDVHLRAEYDRELDGVAADWADVAWGAEVGGDAPAGGAPGRAVRDDEDEPWDDGDPRDGADPAGGDAGPFDLWRLDPFVGPPDPFAGGAAPQAPPRVHRVLETLAAVGTGALGLTVLGLQAWAASGAFDDVPAPGSSDSGGQFVGVLMWLVTGGLAIVLHALSAPRSGGAVGAWVATMFAFSMSVTPLSGPVSPSGPLMASAAAAACTVAMGVAWARTYERRRHQPGRLAALRQRELGWLLNRHHRAVEWNRVRAVPGAVPWGSWLALDDEDRVVATAPAGAPEAWLSALRARRPQPAGRRAT